MRRFITILLLFGLCLSCSYENENPFGFTGSATAIKNGVSWNSNVRVLKNLPYNIGINITFTVLNKDGYKREHLGIARVKTSMDVQRIYLTLLDNQIKNDSVAILYSTLIDDGDVGGDVYGIDSTYNNNYIQLTSIDSKNCEITGKFNFRLILIRDDNDGPAPPNVIEFTNGQFTSRIKKEWLD